MNLKMLNQTELDQRIKSLAQKERDLLYEVLLTIKEIDCRRTYLELGFGSLFDYLVQGVGYSEGSAQRRIDAARLLKEIPDIAVKIQSGEIKLNQISMLQKASREVFKTQSKKVSAQEKIEILASLCHKNHTQSQQQVTEFFDLPVIEATKQTVQADASVRFELTLSKEAFAKIKRAQELLSHTVSNADLGQFFEFLADKVIAQKTGSKSSAKNADPVTTKATCRQSSNTSIVAEPKLTATVAAKEANRPSLKIKRLLHGEQKCCQYIDPKTGRQCNSSWKLQIDHKHSQWAGGDHSFQNLQILCAGHNKMKYRKETAIKYLS